MENKSQVYLFCYKNDKNIESTECFDYNGKRFDVINFYRNNLPYDENFIKNIVNTYEPNKCNKRYFLFTIDFHNNFHHCMTEMIGQLFYYKKLNDYFNIKILIKNNKLILEYLQLLNFINKENIEIIEYNKLYLFENIFLHTKGTKTKNMISNMLNINQYIIYKEIDNIQYYEKIFLYRQNKKRIMTNIDEIINIAKSNNFYIYSPENDNLENQIKLIKKCKILLCELGAGCCNMFFTNQQCKIIILSFLKGWSNKYLFYNNGLLNRNITVLDGKLLKGNEHSCIWNISPSLVENTLNKI